MLDLPWKKPIEFEQDEEMNEYDLESIESDDDIGWKIYSMFI